MADSPLTTWAHIEPRRRTVDPTIGLAGRVADPLWFLCRQLQLGEFSGDDGGTPTHVEVTSTWVPFTHWSPGAPPADAAARTWLAYERDRPLEAMVEDDRSLVGGEAPPVLGTVEAGRRLARRLRRAGLDTVADHAAFERVIVGPRSSVATVALHAGSTIDGFAVRADLDNVRATVSAGLSAADAAAVHSILDEWKQWFDRRFGYPTHPTAWIEERLEHRFSLAAPHPDGGALVLDAPEYLGEGVTWTSLEIRPGAPGPDELAAAPAGAHGTTVVTRVAYPQSLRWPGMPVDRFWQMEDGSVDLGAIRLDPADLPGLLALDMAVTASTDWFVVEVPLPGAGVARIDRIEIVDTFGQRTVAVDRSQAEAALPPGLGLLYAASSGARDGGGWLVLAPRLGHRVDGPIREDVLLVRDEMANLGWIVERVGGRTDGEPGELRSAPIALDAASPEGSLVYRLSTGAPEHWHPLVPRRRPSDARRTFVRGRLFDAEDPLPVTMLARHIDEVLDEEVPREGKRLGRAWQYGRWFDGSRHLWSGRTVNAGRGEASSALRFDVTT